MAAVALAALLTVIGLRAVFESRSDLLAGEAALREGHDLRALERFRRAMRWRAPLNPYPERAAESLRALAVDLEVRGRIDDALLAWRSIAGSAAATRVAFATSDRWRREAIAEIARLTADQEAGRGGEPSEEAIAAAFASHDVSPNPAGGFLLLIGFAAWVGGLVATATRGFDADGRWNPGAARGPLVATVVGWIAFVTGLLLA